MDGISPTLLWEIFKHLRSWLANLNRANEKRQKQSVKALRHVIIAARETQVYLRQLQDSRQAEHNTERHLAMLWTRLGFELQDLGLDKLAKRCHITGKHWADPGFYSADFLQKADISLDRMEALAQQILLQFPNNLKNTL